MKLSQRSRPAFRLNDLVAVIVIVVLVVGLFAPAAEKPRADAARTQCVNNLKQLTLSVHNYASAYQNTLPALTCDVAKPKYGVFNGDMLFTLLPFLEQDAYFQVAYQTPVCTWYAPIAPSTTLPFSTTPPGKERLPLSTHAFKVYQCPADTTIVKGLSANQTSTNTTTAPYYFPWAGSSYAANYQMFGVVNSLGDDKSKVGNSCGPAFNIGNIPDGSSNTVFFGEQFAACGSSAGNLWAYPGIGNYSDKRYTSEPGTAAPAGTHGMTNTAEKTTSKFWTPVFANSNKTYGFTGGGKNGSIFEYNIENRDAKPIAAPYAAGQFWDAPPQFDIRQAQCDKSRLQSFHPGAVAVGMGDASVRIVSGKVTQATWYAAICPADGNLLGSDW
jgi:uncharacterized protein DUF1559